MCSFQCATERRQVLKITNSAAIWRKASVHYVVLPIFRTAGKWLWLGCHLCACVQHSLRKNVAPAGIRTRVIHVTGGYTNQAVLPRLTVRDIKMKRRCCLKEQHIPWHITWLCVWASFHTQSTATITNCRGHYYFERSHYLALGNTRYKTTLGAERFLEVATLVLQSVNSHALLFCS